MYYINYFFIVSIIGFILETFFYMLFNWDGNSGYLFGPWTPVYGIGSIIIILTYNFLYKKIKSNKFAKFIISFITISILLSIVEMIGGYLIESIFNETFWDYSDHKFNLGKYISLEMAGIWGIASIFFIYLIKPIIDRYIYLLPKLITYILTILFIIDNIATIMFKLKLI